MGGQWVYWSAFEKVVDDVTENSTLYESPIPVTSLGTHTFRARSFDQSGRRSALTEFKIVLAVAPPQIEVLPGNWEVSSSGKLSYVNEVTVKLSCASKNAKLEFDLGDGPHSYEQPITLTP